MHETAVAQSVFEEVMRQAAKYNRRPVAIRVSCGQFNALNDHVFCFAMEQIAAGTICEGMKVEVVHVPLQAVCRNCKTSFDFDIYKPLCPKCESMEFDFGKDAELMLDEIEFADDVESFQKVKNEDKP